jgi:beta-mannosidase
VHKPNDPAYGSIHIWDMWNRQDYADYRLKPARFVSEFGWQGPPTWSTLRKAISDEPLTPESPGMLVHQKAMQGNDKLTDGLVAHLPLPNDIEDWHWAMSLNQAIAVRVGIEHLRSLSPSCAGSIVWQLNDCWPATSWAAVDGYGRAKPLLYSIRHAYRDLLVTVQPRGAGLAAVIVNDSSDAVSGRLELARMGFDGTVHSTATVDVVIAPRGALTTELPESVMGFEDPASELIVAALGDSRGTWFPAEYKDSSLTRASMTASADRVDGGYRVSIAANSLVRDLALLADKVHPDAVVDDMLVTLLPGESVVFTVVCDQELDPDQFLAPGVLRTGNDLLHPRGSVSP